MKVGLPKIPVTNAKTAAVKKTVDNFASKQVRNSKQFKTNLKEQTPLLKPAQVQTAVKNLIANVTNAFKKGK